MDVTSSSAADRWLQVGSSADPDAFAAGAQAARQAQDGRAAALVLIFCDATLDARRVVDGVCSATAADAVVAGGTSMGQVAPPLSGVDGIDAGVVVVALGGAGFQARARVSRSASAGRREAGLEAAAGLDTIDLPHRALLLIADGLTREQHEIVRGAYGHVGASVPIIGGCSADHMLYSATYQFIGTGAGVEVLSDAVVGIGLGSSGAMGFGIAHGWSKLGDAMLVTSSEGGQVYQLDDEPAADVYLRRIAGGRTPQEIKLLREQDPVALVELLLNNPLGLSRRSGEDLRVVHDIDFERGSIACLADVPQGALAWAMTTDPDALIDAAGASCDAAVDALDGADPLGFLVFDCGARKARLGPDGVRAEQEAIGKLTGGKPFGGFYTYGEIGRVQGARGMHQLTVVTLALS